MDARQIDELLQQAEQRLEKGSVTVPASDAEKAGQLVPRPTAPVPKDDNGVRPVLKQQSTRSQAKVSQIFSLSSYISAFAPSDEKEPLKVL